MARAVFQVCYDINYVTPGETFVLSNPGASDVTIINCNPPMQMDSYTVPARGTAQVTVCADAVPGKSYPYGGCSRAQPKIIIGS